MGEVLGLNTVDNIINSIYIIRGQQVMLDSDLAKIYGYEVKRLNEQVKRNIKRFPEDFMFQLVESEIPDSLKSQFATLNEKSNRQGSNIKMMPFAFTEQGINMLATELRGELAEQQSIFIISNIPQYFNSLGKSCAVFFQCLIKNYEERCFCLPATVKPYSDQPFSHWPRMR